MNKTLHTAMLFISFFIGGCHSITETDFEKTAKEFTLDLYTFQLTEAQKRCSNSENLQIELIASNIDQKSIDLLKSKGEPIISVSSYQLSPDNLNATVELEITYAIEFNLTNGQFYTPEKLKKQIHLIKANDKWLVESYK